MGHLRGVKSGNSSLIRCPAPKPGLDAGSAVVFVLPCWDGVRVGHRLCIFGHRLVSCIAGRRQDRRPCAVLGLRPILLRPRAHDGRGSLRSAAIVKVLICVLRSIATKKRSVLGSLVAHLRSGTPRVTCEVGVRGGERG